MTTTKTDKLTKTTTTKGFAVDLRRIVSNKKNARVFGPCPSLWKDGFGFMTTRQGSDKPAVMTYAQSAEPAQRAEFVGLIDTREERVRGLSRSILTRGQLQPLVVRPLSGEEKEALGLDVKGDYYDLIDGATRFAALYRLRCIALMTQQEREALGLTPEEIAFTGPVVADCRERNAEDVEAERLSHEANYWSLGTGGPVAQIRLLQAKREEIAASQPDATPREIIRQLEAQTGIDEQTVEGRLLLADKLTEDDLALLEIGGLTLQGAMQKAQGKTPRNNGAPSDTKIKVTLAQVKADYLAEPRKDDDQMLAWAKKKRLTQEFLKLRASEDVRRYMAFILQTEYKPLAEAREGEGLSAAAPEQASKPARKRRTKSEMAADGESNEGTGKVGQSKSRKRKAGKKAGETVESAAESLTPEQAGE